MEWFLIHIDPEGRPGQLTAVETIQDGFDRLAVLAKENHIEISREEIEQDYGFYVGNGRDDVTGFYLVQSE